MPLILVVDDEKERLLSLTEILKRLGHETLQAQRPQAAYRLIRSKRPELVLLNLKMQDLEGVEALIKYSDHLPSIVCHTPDHSWPLYLPLGDTECPVFDTNKLAAVLEQLAVAKAKQKPATRKKPAPLPTNGIVRQMQHLGHA